MSEILNYAAFYFIEIIDQVLALLQRSNSYVADHSAEVLFLTVKPGNEIDSKCHDKGIHKKGEQSVDHGDSP